MASFLTKFLPNKDTTTNINDKIKISGQALFETDECHKLYIDYPLNGAIISRNVVIDCNIALADFSVVNSTDDNAGYNSFSLLDENRDITYESIPHTRYTALTFSVSNEGDIPIFEIDCDSNLNLNEYKFFLELFLTSVGGVINDNGTTKKAFCYNVKPTSIEHVSGNSNYDKIVVTYPPFDEDLYGVSIPSSGTLMLYLYVYTKSNNGGCSFWITGED